MPPLIPQWFTFAMTILNAIIQVVKLVIELQREDKDAAKQAPAAIRCARKECDASKLQSLLDQAKKG